MKKKLCCILMLIALLLNSSILLVISEAVDAVQTSIEQQKINALAEINLTKYENFDTTIENSSEGSKGVLAQFNLKTGIEFKEGDQYTPIKKTNINVEIPTIDNQKPTRVEVITNSTKATNGGKEAKYQYNSNTGILEISAENNDYTENNADARDEYQIICIYGSECYTDNEERSLKIKTSVEEILNDEAETKITTKNEEKYDVKENISGVISVEHQTDDVYNGYITANAINPSNQYETSYKETSKIMISDKDLVQKIEVKEESETSLYTSTSIDKNKVVDMLGDKGSVEILDESGNTLSTINKDTDVDENGKIKVTYTDRTKTLFIRLNDIVKEGIIEVENERVILPTAQISNDTISTNVSIKGIIDSVKYERNEAIETQLKQATSNIDIKLNTQTLVNNTANDVILTATLRTDDPKYSLFKNPSINIAMPEEVEKLEIGTPEIMYNNQVFTIESSEVSVNNNGNKVVNLKLQGSQTAYETSSVVNGTNIRIPLKITLAKSIENKKANITTAYSNEITGTTESKDTEVTLLNKIVNVIPTIYDAQSENSSNSEEQNAVNQQDGIKTEITEQLGNVTIANNSTIYEQQIVKQNIKVTNTSNTSKKVSVVVNVPDEMTYVVKKDDNGYIYHQDKNYYEYSKKYEYEEQQDKQVTVELDVNPGETKTDFIELKVKDLNDNEQEKQTNINYVVKVNGTETTQFNIQNTIKQAEIMAELQCIVGSTRKEWQYVLKVTNLTNKELKNVKVAFEASDIFNIKHVDIDNDTRLTNLGGNVWTYAIDSINPAKTNENGEYLDGQEFYIITGDAENIEANSNGEYEINGVATIYGDEIATYVSNEARMTGYAEAVEVKMSADKDKIKMDDEITYTVNIKNTGKTWGGFATYTDVNVQDVIPRELTPISVTYNKFTINRQTVTDEYDREFEAQTYSEEQVTKDLSTLDIPEGYDEEDAPNIDLPLTIPEGQTVTMTIKAKAKMLMQDETITNTMTAKGDWIKEENSNVTTTILKYNTDADSENPVDPIDPVNPVDPVDPSNPTEPVNPDDSNNTDSTSQKVTISGVAWIDENSDGKRSTEEKTYSNMTVMLYDYKNDTFVKENGQNKKVQTDANGAYQFENVEKGQYIVVFLYDTEAYSVAEYQKSGVLESKNSDAITKNINIDGQDTTAGLTDTLTADKNLTNIDIGLVENKKFDLGIQKYISKITVQTPDGKTKVYDYDNKQFAKVEIHSKKINGATVIIEYKMVVTNNGELTGKVAQVVDKLPDGLKFKSELNNEWYESNGNLYTNSLSGQDINVGESKEVTLVLTKDVNSSNVGTINNIAEIGISSNNKAVEDQNKDNDTSNAQVLVGVSTGLVGRIGIAISTTIILMVIALLIWKNRRLLKAALFVSVLAICLVGNASQVLGLSIKGDHMGKYGTLAIGDDGKRYYCNNIGAYFCSTHWHPATLYNTVTTSSSEGEWTDLSSTPELVLTNNTNNNNVAFSKIDDNYNKVGPFKVSSTITDATSSVTTYYKDKNGNNGTSTFELINFGWGNEFYIKIPNTVVQINKITINANYKVEQTRTVTKTTTYYYKVTVPAGDTWCAQGTVQTMRRTETTTTPEKHDVKRQGSIDIIGPWTAPGDLEILKVDSKDNQIVLANAEFKLLKGSNKNASMVIHKDGKKIDRIKVAKDITLDLSSGVYGTEIKKSATIDGVSGYTIEFNSTIDKATVLVTNNEGKVLIKNLLYGKYTFVETDNLNYGYTKMVTTAINGFSPLSQTTWTVKNEKQVGEIHIRKGDDRVESKLLPGVEFVLRASNQDGYLKVKASGNKITTDSNGWATKAVGTVTISDGDNRKNNPVIEYTTNIDEATRFVTDSNSELYIKNLLLSTNGTDIIKYKLEEVANPNYGYLADTNQYKNYKVLYDGQSVTSDGWITPSEKDSNDVIEIKNHQEYIRIEGYVWEELSNSKDNTINNVYDKDVDALVEGLKVYLCKDNNVVAQTVTNSDGWYGFGTRKSDGEAYTNKDYFTVENGDLKIDDLAKYHVEFEYDGLRFTSIEAIIDYVHNNYENNSKATEVPSGRSDKKDRTTVNDDFTIISNKQSHNSNGAKTYDLDYAENNHVATYIDKWGYEYNENKSRLKVTPTSEYAIIASTKQSGFAIDKAWEARCKDSGADTLTGINLGIKRREQADLAISEDLNEMNIIVNKGTESYNNTYTYSKRDSEQEADNFGVDVKFGTATGSYSDRGLNLYTRRIYESDLAWATAEENKDKEVMKIYATYRIRIKNQSNSLTAKVRELANYYDERYEISESWIAYGDKTTNATWGTSKYGNTSVEQGYVATYTESTGEIEIASGEYIDVYIKFKLKPEAVKALIQKQTTLNNVSEINAFSTLKDNKAYAAIDEDSNPGNTKIELIKDGTTSEVTLNGRPYEIENKTLNNTTFEDDTDTAPSLVLGIEGSDKDNDKKYTRGLSGTVFEDSNTKGNDPNATNTGEERIGNGKFDANENLVENAKVELLEYDGEGNAKVATLYQLSVTDGIVTTNTVPAIVKTSDKGTYEFLGVLPGRYLIRYTYNNETKINGKPIDPRDYKSTIITSNTIKNALNLDADDAERVRKGNLNWILTYDGEDNQVKSKSKDANGLIRYSDAVDDLNKRAQQEEQGIYYGNLENTDSENAKATMTADTAFFDVGVEYSAVKDGGFNERVSFTDYKDEYNLQDGKIVVTENGKIKLVDTFYAVNPCQDFGIIERPRQDYKINKRISFIKLTLANGQVLINGNPYQKVRNLYTDWDNIEKSATGDNALPYVKALPSQVVAEIDNELIQGATLELEYTISLKNDSEIDYEYNPNPNYYYYGNKENGQLLTSVVKKVVDYMEDDIVYDEEKNSGEWTKVTAENLSAWDENGTVKKLVSDAAPENEKSVAESIKSGYTISMTEKFADKTLKLQPGSVASVKINAGKLLANSEDGFGASNHVEIVETRRKLFGATPGNYNPETLEQDETDNSHTRISVTPPTGLTDNRIFIISMTAVTLIALAGGVYIIKKKVLG